MHLNGSKASRIHAQPTTQEWPVYVTWLQTRRFRRWDWKSSMSCCSFYSLLEGVVKDCESWQLLLETAFLKYTLDTLVTLS